jgi:5-bromo-4-chloroindolyl phosphate hydrolysis protein
MSKFFLFFLILLIKAVPPGDNSTTVYLCDSKNATRYHYKSNCKGLSNCSYKVVQSTVESARKTGKTLCKWEY